MTNKCSNTHAKTKQKTSEKDQNKYLST